MQPARERLHQHGVLVGEIVGHGVQLDSCATRPSLQPPPVSRQKPVCSPADRLPSITLRHSAGTPCAHSGHGGVTPRTLQPSAGWTTTRSPRRGPAPISPTISWPGTNGVLVSVARCSDALPETSARSEPQMPVSFGRTGSQPGPGMRGGRTSLSASAPAPGRPARVATYLAMLGV